MKVEYVDPPVDKDEISVYNNYRQIKCKVKDRNNKTLIIAWKHENGIHIVVWRLDYSHTFRKLHPDHPPEKEVRSGSCWEAFDTIDEILALVNSWQKDTALLHRMSQWYGANSPYMPLF